MDPRFSFSSFISMLLPLVAVPVLLGAAVIWMITRAAGLDTRTAGIQGDRPWVGWRTGGRLGLWTTGLLGAAWGFIASAGWLSWTASDKGGGFTGPSLTPPTSFPMWQIIGCGVTVIGGALLVSLCARLLIPGAMAAALGVAAGFATAFALGAAKEVMSQEGIGVAFSMIGLTVGLGVVTLFFAFLREWQIQRNSGTPRV